MLVSINLVCTSYLFSYRSISVLSPSVLGFSKWSLLVSFLPKLCMHFIPAMHAACRPAQKALVIARDD